MKFVFFTTALMIGTFAAGSGQVSPRAPGLFMRSAGKISPDVFNDGRLSLPQRTSTGTRYPADFRFRRPAPAPSADRIFSPAGSALVSILSQTWSAGAWVNASEDSLLYDSAGRKTGDLWGSFDDSGRQNSYLYSYQYDTGGNNTSELIQEWSDTGWAGVFLINFSYDAGQETSAVYMRRSGNGWTGYLKTSLVSDSADRAWFWLTLNWSAGGWIPTGRIGTFLNGEGMDTMDIWQEYADTGWVNSERAFYSYGTGGRESSERWQMYADTGWMDFGFTTFTYDADGKESDELFQTRSDTGWANRYLDSLTYDAAGNEATWTEQIWSPSGWINSFRRVMTWRVPLAVRSTAGLPRDFALLQNYPNPFNPSTTITFTVPVRERVRVEIYDLLGRSVALLSDAVLTAGSYSLRWDAGDLPSGIYFCRFRSGPAGLIRKMLLVR